jgi:hypothetical protein
MRLNIDAFLTPRIPVLLHPSFRYKGCNILPRRDTDIMSNLSDDTLRRVRIARSLELPALIFSVL